MESRIFLNDALTGILLKAVLKPHQCHNFKSTKGSNVNLKITKKKSLNSVSFL